MRKKIPIVEDDEEQRDMIRSSSILQIEQNQRIIELPEDIKRKK